MKILAVGGGSGGHITPIIAVVKELLKKDSKLEIEVWSDAAFVEETKVKLSSVDATISVRAISSGKLRRYHGVPLWKQLLRVRTIVFPNVIDSFKLMYGTVQSIYRLRSNRPDVIFCKGGFVCLPVGIAARLLSIPVVLHDSDAHPGLTNRILSKSARFIATGAPLEYYDYTKEQARYIGTPIDSRFKKYSKEKVADFKQELGFDSTRPLVVITGGGLGAEALNTATLALLPELLEVTNVLLIAGKTNYAKLTHTINEYDERRYRLEAFVGKKMVETLAAADIVVARAGATTLLELSALAKPTIIVPNPYLTGGHQLKNAEVYAEHDGAVILDEKELAAQPYLLLDTINSIVLNDTKLHAMSKAIHAFAKPEAAHDMAELILQATKSR